MILSTLAEALAAASSVQVAYETQDRPVLLLDGTTHYVYIKGTSAMRDMLTDVEAALHWMGAPEPVRHAAHRGFLSIADDVAAIVLSRIKKEERIVIAGHSLGGAVATLLAWKLARAGFTNLTVYTFGSPRVFSPKAARYYKKLVPDTTRILHDRDLVPRVPVWGYRHVGSTLHIKGNGSRVLGIKGGWRTLVDWLGFRSHDVFDHSMSNYVTALENRFWKGLAL